MKVKHEQYWVITDCIHVLDEEISKMVNQIIHSKEFQTLEATWRGLKYLVDNTTTSEDSEDSGDGRRPVGARGRQEKVRGIPS